MIADTTKLVSFWSRKLRRPLKKGKRDTPAASYCPRSLQGLLRMVKFIYKIGLVLSRLKPDIAPIPA